MDVAVVAVAASHLDRRHHPLRHRPAHQVGLDVNRRHHQGGAPPDPLEVRDRAQRAVDHVEVDRELSHPRQRVEERVEVEAKVVEPLVREPVEVEALDVGEREVAAEARRVSLRLVLLADPVKLLERHRGILLELLSRVVVLRALFFGAHARRVVVVEELVAHLVDRLAQVRRVEVGLGARARQARLVRVDPCLHLLAHRVVVGQLDVGIE